MPTYPDLYFRTHEEAVAEFERRLIGDQVYHLDVRPWSDPFLHEGKTYVYRVRTIRGQMDAEAKADLRAVLKSRNWLEAKLAECMTPDAVKRVDEFTVNAMISYRDRIHPSGTIEHNLRELAATPEPRVRIAPAQQNPSWQLLTRLGFIMLVIPGAALLVLYYL